MGEKTEKATPKKLRDARNKGQVARSQDFPSAFTFMTSIVLVVSMASHNFKILSTYFLSVFRNLANLSQQSAAESVGNILSQGMFVILQTSLPIAFMVAAVGVFVNFLIIGPIFTFEVFKPDIKKFNPVDNLKAKFKLKTLIELLKSMFKITVAAYIVWITMQNHVGEILQTVDVPMEVTVLLVGKFLWDVAIKVGIFFLAIAVFDLGYQKYNFSKEMMMEKHEVKQEYKNSEGDPQVKGKRKEFGREIVFGQDPPIKKSKAVVTNPTHIAVALGYAPKKNITTPYIIDMGEGNEAKRIIAEAEKYEIPILQNIDLAHVLFDEGEVMNYIPEESFELVGEVLQWISELKGQEWLEDEPDND